MDLHGIQCAVGTYLALQMYDHIRTATPDPDKARAYVAAFDKEAWHNRLRQLLGSAAEGMIELDKKENKYDPATHEQRLARILDWEPIVAIMNEELPETEAIDKLLDLLEMPKTVEELGTDKTLLPDIIRATKDIRDKYVTSRLAFDLGLLDEILEKIK
jgi:glycerol-1-phosphate dehydrogenase [NAD(P)+]